MMESRPVYTLFRGNDAEPPMRLSVDEWSRLISLSEDHGSETGCTIIKMTPHRAKAIGECLVAMADGLVKAETK